MKNLKSIISAAIEIAFEAGKWAGQVELEEHFDKEQYSSAVIESISSKRTSMPNELPSNGREVKIRLRSDKWRKGVIKDSVDYKKQAIKILEESLLDRKGHSN